MTDEAKIAAWDRIAAAWETYCNEGAGSFDWDFDSRKVMHELTGNRAFQFITREAKNTRHEPGPDWTCTCGYDYFGGSAAYSWQLFEAHLPSKEQP